MGPSDVDTRSQECSKMFRLCSKVLQMRSQMFHNVPQCSKMFHNAPQCLQDMIERLQKYAKLAETNLKIGP